MGGSDTMLSPMDLTQSQKMPWVITCSDTMRNYRLSQKLKLLRNGELNHLIIYIYILNLLNSNIQEVWNF